MGTNASTESAALKDSHHACFACGAGNPTGLNLHFDTDSAGGVSAVWLPSAAFQSYPDRVHGGVISTLLDGAMVHALFAQGIVGVTAELTIRYLQSVNVRDAVHIHGSIEGWRHGVYLCRAEAHQAGRLVVRAVAKFMALTGSPEAFFQARRTEPAHSKRPSPPATMTKIQPNPTLPGNS